MIVVVVGGREVLFCALRLNCEPLANHRTRQNQLIDNAAVSILVVRGISIYSFQDRLRRSERCVALLLASVALVTPASLLNVGTKR